MEATAKRMNINVTDDNKVSLFEKLTDLFKVSEEYAAGYFLMNHSYSKTK